MVKILNLKLVILLELVSNWCEEVFVITKVENTFRGHILLVILEGKKFLERPT